MNKLGYFSVAFIALSSLSIWAIDNLSRTGTGQAIVQSGTTTLNGSTLVESTSTTNIFQLSIVTATATGAQTASTNTFSTAYLATPSVARGVVSGLSSTQITNSWAVGATVSTTTLIVTGLSTNATTGVNGVPMFIYGYQRTGKLP